MSFATFFTSCPLRHTILSAVFYIYKEYMCRQETLCRRLRCKDKARIAKTINPCKSKTYRGIRWE